MLFQSYKIFCFDTDTLIPYKAPISSTSLLHIFFCCHFHNFTVSFQTGNSSQPIFGASLTLVCLSLEICACLVAAWYASTYALDYVSFGKIMNCVHNLQDTLLIFNNDVAILGLFFVQCQLTCHEESPCKMHKTNYSSVPDSKMKVSVHTQHLHEHLQIIV